MKPALSPIVLIVTLGPDVRRRPDRWRKQTSLAEESYLVLVLVGWGGGEKLAEWSMGQIYRADCGCIGLEFRTLITVLSLSDLVQMREGSHSEWVRGNLILALPFLCFSFFKSVNQFTKAIRKKFGVVEFYRYCLDQKNLPMWWFIFRVNKQRLVKT